MSAEAAKPWDLTKLSINFLGIDLNKGLGEGDTGTVKIEKQKDDFDEKEGADGSVVRVATSSTLYYVTLSLLQTSSINILLTGINVLDKATPNGAGIGPIAVINQLGLDVFTGSQAWIKGPPKTVEWGQQAGNREWIFVVADGVQIVGGS